MTIELQNKDTPLESRRAEKHRTGAARKNDKGKPMISRMFQYLIMISLLCHCAMVFSASLMFSWRVDEDRTTYDIYKPDKDGIVYAYSSTAVATYDKNTDTFTLTCSGDDSLIKLTTGSNLKILLKDKSTLRLEEKVSTSEELQIDGPGEVFATTIYSDGSMHVRGAILHVNKIHTYLDPLLIEDSIIYASGDCHLLSAHDIRIVASMLYLSHNKDSSDSALHEGGQYFSTDGLSIEGCFVAIDSRNIGIGLGRMSLNMSDSCAAIVSDGTCLSAPTSMTFENVDMIAISRTGRAMSTIRTPGGAPYRAYNGVTCQVSMGLGHYFLVSGTDYPACSCGVVRINGAEIQCVSPNSYGFRSYEAYVDGGRVDAMNAIDINAASAIVCDAQNVCAKLSKQKEFSTWTDKHANFCNQVNAWIMQVNATPGAAEAVFAADYYEQHSGEIVQGCASMGYKATYLGTSDFISNVSTPALCGGIFNGIMQTYGRIGNSGYVTQDISPTNSFGVVLAHVDYSPFWVIPDISVQINFDVNGGHCTEIHRTIDKGASVGALPMPVHEGYNFMGWFTAAVGGEQIVPETVVTADATLYAQWKIVEYAIAYELDEGENHVENPATYTVEDAVTLKTPTKNGFTFKGWTPDGGVIAKGSTGDKTFTATWEAVMPKKHAVTFDASGGNADEVTWQIEDGAKVGALPATTRTGYNFLGWFTEEKGGEQITAETVVTADVTFYAHWQAIAYSITYADTKGAPNANLATYTIEDAVTFVALTDVDGWTFTGWSISGIAKGTTGNITVTAQWEKTKTPIDVDNDEPMDASAANTYDGVIVNTDGLPMGYITVKTAKASGKGDVQVSKVTATIQMVGETKNVTLKANVVASDATMSQAASDGRILDLTFTRYGISGSFDGYEIDGARNLLASTAKADKGTDAKVAAEAVLASLKGNYALAYQDDNGWNGLSITVMAKGKVRVSGKLANGTSVSTTSPLIVGSDSSVIPDIYTKGSTSLAFNVYFSNESAKTEVFGSYDAVISPVAGLNSGLSFYLDDEIYDLFEDYSLCDQFLPYGLSVEPVSASKWSVANGAKAGSIKLKDGEVIDTKGSDNPSGLKLTFNSRTGTFSGSFKVYALDSKNKLKTFAATVSGVVVDGVGYGVATIKKIGSCAVVIAE